MHVSFKLKLIAGALVLDIGLLLGATVAAASGTTPLVAQSHSVAESFRDMRASKLIGSKVINDDGENMGKINDLIVDVNNDRVYYAVLSIGGFLGFGDRLLAYPLRMFAQAEEGDKIVLNVDKVKLKPSPALGGDRGFDWRSYYGGVDRYFGKPIEVGPMSNQLLRGASELLGKDVKGRDGEDLGGIGDLVINVGKGSVRYAVLEFNQPSNANNSAVMVPLRVFDFSADRGEAVLRVDKSNLDKAFAFDKNHWPLINSTLFLDDVDRYLILVDPNKHPSDGDVQVIFDRLDVNRDNKLSAAEARQDNKVLGAWPQLDAKRAGEITRAEFAAKHNAILK